LVGWFWQEHVRPRGKGFNPPSRLLREQARSREKKRAMNALNIKELRIACHRCGKLLGVYRGESFYFVSEAPITILCSRCLEEARSRGELVELGALARAFAECVRDLSRRERCWKVPT